jgi:VCBS repeat protein
VDWNKDGYLDILSGCYWSEDAKAGHILMLAGKGSLDFAAAVAVKNSAGKPLENIQLVDGDNARQILTICTQQHAVDYDGDGDLDLVVGCFGPNFYLYENSGSNGELTLSENPVELPVKSTSYHSAPHLVDWDGDGDLDLLSGCADGGVIISENTGTRAKPEWSAFQQLIPPSSLHSQSTFNGEEIVPSPSTRIWCTDWNGDGLQDLLMGDCATITNPKEGLDAAEYARRLKELDDKKAALQQRHAPAYREFAKFEQTDELPSQELQDKMSELSAELRKLKGELKEFQTSTRTGFVWLYLRKPTADSATSANSRAP